MIIFSLLFLLLSCSGSGQSTHKVIRGSAGTVFPDSDSIRALVMYPEVTFNSEVFATKVKIESNELSAEGREVFTTAAESFLYVYIVNIININDSLRIFNNGSILEKDGEELHEITDIQNESDYTKFVVDDEDNIIQSLIIKQVGTINDNPYFTISLEITPKDGYKLVLDSSDVAGAADINAPINGASKITANLPNKYILQELEDIDNIPFDNSLRPQSNKIEDNFSLNSITAITKDLKVKKISSNELSDIKDIMVNIIKDIISKPIPGDENDFINSKLPQIQEKYKIKRKYLDMFAYSEISEDRDEDSITITHYQLTFNKRSFHKIIIVADSFKVNNGSLELSSDSDSYILLECSFTSDIIE